MWIERGRLLPARETHRRATPKAARLASGLVEATVEPQAPSRPGVEGCVLVASAASRKSLAIAYSIHRILGLRVAGLFHARHPYLYSRHFDARAVVGAPRPSTAWARAALQQALRMGCDTVVPVDYADVLALSGVEDEFRRQGVALAAPPHESVVTASDKTRLPELLRGIAETPRQVLVDGEEALGLIEELEPPLVVKGLGDASSPTYHYSRGSAAEEARRRRVCLVQEYVAGVGRGYYAVAYEGEPLLEFTHERLVERDPVGGASLAARGPVGDYKLTRMGRLVLRRLRWTGPLMVESKYDLDSGEHYVVELNPKFWGSLDLPVSLGYHFPAILVEAYRSGPSAARELAGKLEVRSGSYAWVVDGVRYLAKLPDAWLRLARIGLGRRGRSDADPSDPARLAAQVWTALRRLQVEKERWGEYLSAAGRETREWVRSLAAALSRDDTLLLLDLDGVVVDLKVDWPRVYAELSGRGLMRRGEHFSGALARLWSSDKDAYTLASRIAEPFELEALERSPYLLSGELLRRLSESYDLYVVTKQPVRVAVEALRRLGVEGHVGGVVGRDSGYGPQKKDMIGALLADKPGAGAILIDDRLGNLVEAVRAGATPILASKNPYQAAGSLRLGIPAAPPREVAELLARIAEA
ncbi:MAG: hypothetical protein ABWK01_07500 [Infirmifilum sp.]